MFDKNELLLAWTAGFFDGEGSVIVELSKSPKSIRGWRTRLQATITQTSLPCLELIQKNLGGVIKISDCKNSRARRWATQYTLEFANQKASEFLSLIEPYSVVKKEQIAVALKYPLYDKDGKKYGNSSRPMPEDVWRQRLWIREELKNIRASMKTAAMVYDHAK